MQCNEPYLRSFSRHRNKRSENFCDAKIFFRNSNLISCQISSTLSICLQTNLPEIDSTKFKKQNSRRYKTTRLKVFMLHVMFSSKIPIRPKSSSDSPRNLPIRLKLHVLCNGSDNEQCFSLEFFEKFVIQMRIAHMTTVIVHYVPMEEMMEMQVFM